MLSVLSRLSENSSRTHDTLILRLKQTKRKKCRTMTQAKRQGSETCVVGLQKTLQALRYGCSTWVEQGNKDTHIESKHVTLFCYCINLRNSVII